MIQTEEKDGTPTMPKATKAAKKNPVTTIFGILTIAAALAPIWAPANLSAKIQKSALALTGAGLVAAKDGNKE